MKLFKIIGGIFLAISTLVSIVGAVFFGGISTMFSSPGTNPADVIGPAYYLWFLIPFILWVLYFMVIYFYKKQKQR